MNLLMTLDDHYVHPCSVMMHSILTSNPSSDISFYVIYQNLSEESRQTLRQRAGNSHITFLRFPDSLLSQCPTSKRYPKEMYFRLFAPELLPDSLDRILYLDPDLVVINPLDDLYAMDFEGNSFIAATHVQKFFRKFNEHRLNLEENTPYINTGVLLMNLEILRKEHSGEAIRSYIDKNRRRLLLPDQDVFTALYGQKTKIADASLYNLGEIYLITHKMTKQMSDISIDWVRSNTVIVHYYGKNKPWKKDYKCSLDVFYHEILSDMESQGTPHT